MTLTDLPAAAEIVELKQPAADIKLFKVRINDLRIRRDLTYLPGQFFQISAAGAGEAPFSPVSAPSDDGSIDFCIKKAGHVTARLHALDVGEQVYLRGPFGNGFPIEEMVGRDLYLAAGGLGIVPLRSLLVRLLQERERYGNITFMYGAKEPRSLLFREELQRLSCSGDVNVMLTVDFAAEDEAGAISCNVGLLPDLLQGVAVDAIKSYAVVCGPPALYRCLIAELSSLGFHDDRILLSLERRMKCGVGRCAHCAVGQHLCCLDGPVFRYSQLKDIEGAL